MPRSRRDDEPRPRRQPKSALPLILGGVAAVVLLLGGCVVGAAILFWKGGGVPGAPPGGGPFTVSEALVRPADPTGLQPGMTSVVDIDVRFSPKVLNAAEDLYVVVQSHYARSAPGPWAKLPPGEYDKFTARLSARGLPSAPYDVWLEKRTPSGGVIKVSNTLTVQTGWTGQ